MPCYQSFKTPFSKGFDKEASYRRQERRKHAITEHRWRRGALVMHNLRGMCIQLPCRCKASTYHNRHEFEYLFWVGCMGSFDSRIRKYIADFAELAKKAGIIDKIAILGEEEACCGDPARRLGEEGKFQELALSNIEKFKKYGVKKILVICPHGLNTFKNEYSRLDEWMKGIEV